MAERLRPDAPVFGISVAAELTGVNPQTLRAYEAKGLLDPQRTAGGTRRYSSDDLERVRRICLLLESGLNLEGVRQVLDLQDETALLRAELAGYRDEATGE